MAPLLHRVIIAERVLEAAPRYVCAEARIRFEEIADGVKDLPADSVFWESLAVSRLCLVLRGWSFFYTLERGTLRVTDVCK
jgi:hypothetical protein